MTKGTEGHELGLLWPLADRLLRPKRRLKRTYVQLLATDVLDPFETFVLLNCTTGSGVLMVMTNCRILYFREGILEASDEVACDDLLAAAKLASSTHPHLTAEIWWNQKKVGVVRPCWNRREA